MTVKFTDSKSDIWAELKAVKAQLDAAPKAPVTTTEVAETTKVSKAVAVASAVSVDVVEQAVTALVSKVAEAKDQYNSIVTAIDAKKVELKDILDIEVEANTLVAIVATKEQLVAKKDAEAIALIESAKERAIEIADEIKARRAEAEESIRSINATAKQAREREQEEYTYNFARTKKSQIDAHNDEINAKNKVLDEREASIASREATVKVLDAEILDLKSMMDVRVAKAEAEAKKSAESSANLVKLMVIKEHEAQVSIKDARIATLEEKVTELMAQLTKAQDQVIAAHGKVTDMAQSAFQAQGDAATITRVSELAVSSGNKK